MPARAGVASLELIGSEELDMAADAIGRRLLGGRRLGCN
jgi:hypothetical protein